jgi:ubiquinone biosynthesis protein Coq4
MTDTPKKIVVNCETGITEEIELTAEEIAQLESDRATAEAERLERELQEAAKTAARESALAKLAALGLTDDEIQAL